MDITLILTEVYIETFMTMMMKKFFICNKCYVQLHKMYIVAPKDETVHKRGENYVRHKELFV